MKITLEFTKKVLGDFAVVFPLPTPHVEAERLVMMWFCVLEEFYIADVNAACKRLMRTLKRFPYPADVVEEIGKAADEAKEANAQA